MVFSRGTVSNFVCFLIPERHLGRLVGGGTDVIFFSGFAGRTVQKFPQVTDLGLGSQQKVLEILFLHVEQRKGDVFVVEEFFLKIQI